MEIINTIKNMVAKKKVVMAPTCENCQGSGSQCSVCTPVFTDTFGA